MIWECRMSVAAERRAVADYTEAHEEVFYVSFSFILL